MANQANTTTPAAQSPFKIRQIDAIMASAMMMILAVLLFPIPTPLLDILLVISMGVSILVLMYIIDLKDPLHFSSFPSVLLIVTLFRLALNVATTRQILLNAFGGNVIQAFGDFVVGGNYAVGLVIFAILTTINFKVITAGSGRIAEVAARFTLDAMPGKQMSIDADLNQGLIDEKEAMTRREKLRKEADFYGAMDGASKFVRGDAVAGLIICFINVGAGFFIGMIQKGMSAAESAARYTILTVGDGLVAQIPAIIISTAAGMLVTRAAAEENLASEVGKQLFLRPKQLMITGGVLATLALIPGLPFAPFMIMGTTLGGLGLKLRSSKTLLEQQEKERSLTTQSTALKGAGRKGLEAGKEAGGKAAPAPSSATNLKSILTVSPMDLEIGFGLVPLVDKNQGGRLIERISNVRTQMAEELGIILPPVNVRDNVNLKNNEYLIKIRGLEVTRGFVKPGSLLAIDPGGEVKMEGFQPVREPAFGFVAYWIPESKKESCEAKGLTVVDCSSVITTHLASIVKRHAADLLTRQDVNDLIEQAKETHSAVVAELIPNKMSVGSVHRVLQGLLKEKVSIRDLPIILETLADNASRTQEVLLLVELCRRALGGLITKDYLMPDGTLKAIGLHPNLESFLKKSSHKEGSVIGSLTIDPAVAREILNELKVQIETARRGGIEPIILCSPGVRPYVRQLTMHEFKDTGVLSFAEVPDTIQVDVISMLPVPNGVEIENN
jgi:flagellar biosynthesis protein FlhA